MKKFLYLASGFFEVALSNFARILFYMFQVALFLAVIRGVYTTLAG